MTGWGAGGLFAGDVKGDLLDSRLAFSTDLSTKHVVKAAPGCVTARGAYAPSPRAWGEGEDEGPAHGLKEEEASMQTEGRLKPAHAPHPPAGTFSPQAETRRISVMLAVQQTRT